MHNKYKYSGIQVLFNYNGFIQTIALLVCKGVDKHYLNKSLKTFYILFFEQKSCHCYSSLLTVRCTQSNGCPKTLH